MALKLEKWRTMGTLALGKIKWAEKSGIFGKTKKNIKMRSWRTFFSNVECVLSAT